MIYRNVADLEVEWKSRNARIAGKLVIQRRIATQKEEVQHIVHQAGSKKKQQSMNWSEMISSRQASQDKARKPHTEYDDLNMNTSCTPYL